MMLQLNTFLSKIVVLRLLARFIYQLATILLYIMILIGSSSLHKTAISQTMSHDLADNSSPHLLQASSDRLNFKNHIGQTALTHAIIDGDKRLVRKLLAAGADPDMVDALGQPPIFIAAMHGDQAILKSLLDYGANIHGYASIDKSTALHIAANRGYVQLVKFLIENGANTRLKTNENFTPLDAAAVGGHATIIDILVAAGAELNPDSDPGNILLEIAIKKGYEQVAERLVKLGSDVNAVDNNGITLLQYAAFLGHTNMVRLLVSHGAHINSEYSSPDQRHLTALDFALIGKNDLAKNSIVQYLRDNNAKHASASRVAAELINTLLEEVKTALLRGNFDEALEKSQKSLKASREHGGGDFIVSSLLMLSYVYLETGKHQQANDLWKEAETISTENMETDKKALIHTYRGLLHKITGDYQQAIEEYKKAQNQYQSLDDRGGIATIYNNIGEVYRLWGAYDEALRFHGKALEIDKKLKRNRESAIDIQNIGLVYFDASNYNEAIKNYTLVLSDLDAVEDFSIINGILHNLSLVYMEVGKIDDALTTSEKALNFFRKSEQSRWIALALGLHSRIQAYSGNIEDAIKTINEAVDISRTLKAKAYVANNLSILGWYYILKHEYKEAEKYLWEAVNLKESLRKTATGKTRRDYLASQIESFKLLNQVLFQQGKIEELINSMELMRARLLSERLAKTSSDIVILSEIQNNLAQDTVVLSFANTDMPRMILVAITRDHIQEFPIDLNNYLDDAPILLINKERDPQQRGVKLSWENPTRLSNKSKSTSLSLLINKYREIMQGGLEKDATELRYLSKVLHRILIRPALQKYNDKKHFIIIPDGSLAFLPFETLMEEDGTYLIEHHEISYIQSLTIWQQVNTRRFGKRKFPLLAVGGPLYETTSKATQSNKNINQLAYLKEKVHVDLENNNSLLGTYIALGLNQFKNLPGSLQEVNNISKVINGTRLLTDKNASENSIKKLSIDGKLSQYKIIHLATHGITVPEIPELSAIVLSQFSQKENQEDGYLRMSEIENLKLQADFVNLSACETGLGKLFGGEGVVGLTQSFLIAGSNSVSVSLWPVDDIATSIFMTVMYYLVENKNLSFSEAMTETKRAFISGRLPNDLETTFNSSIKLKKRHRHARYWAPFVYYGSY